MLTSLLSSPRSRYVALAALVLLSTRLLSFYLNSRRIANLLRAARQLKARQYARDVNQASAEWKGSDLKDKSPEEDRLLHSSVRDLISSVQSGKVSALAIALTFIKQSIRVHQRTNALSETNFTNAIADAKRFDSLSPDQKSALPLAGLPISVKDSLNLKGLDTTLGLVNFADQPASEDALIVQQLKAKGAFIHTKTNVPQTLLSFETRNPLFGLTINPINGKFTSGGSSGGESALIANGGSVVGIATDIGGSVRIPASYTGIAAIKPTSRRISTQGFRPSVPGQEAIPGVAGVMAKTTDDICMVLKEILVPEVWNRDQDIIPLPLNMSEINREGPLRIGYFVEDDFLPASPPCQRGVLDTVEALKRAGHTLIPFKPPSILKCVQLYYSLMSADYGLTLTNQLRNDQYEDYTTTLVAAARMPWLFKQLSSFIASNILGDSKASTLLLATGEKRVSQYWSLQAERKRYRQQWMDEWNRVDNQFDAIICVSHLLPPIKHYDYKNISFTCAPTMIFNVLDWPAGVVPVTQVKPNEHWMGNGSGILEKRVRKCYHPVEMAGLPIGVQVAALPHREEAVLRAMKAIEKAVQYKRPAVDGF